MEPSPQPTVEQNIWRWVCLAIAILILALGFLYAWNKAPHKRSVRNGGFILPTYASLTGQGVIRINVEAGAYESAEPVGSNRPALKKALVSLYKTMVPGGGVEPP